MLEVIVVSKAYCTNDSEVTQIRKTLEDHLKKQGFSGDWELALFHITGCSATIKYKRIYNKEITKQRFLLYEIKAFSRDSGWEVLVTPPPTLTLEEVEKVETKVSPISEIKEIVQKSVRSEGQIVKAKVVKHYTYGIDVLIDNKDIASIGKADLVEANRPYNSIDLVQEFPMNSIITVQIVSINRTTNEIVCTTKFSLNEESKSEYTGIPNQDGFLSVNGYLDGSEGFDRRIDLVKILAFLTIETGAYKPISHERAVKVISDHIKEEAKKLGAVLPLLDGRGVAQILRGLCSEKYNFITRHIIGKKGKYNVLEYNITNQGWQEIGAKDLITEILPTAPVDPQLEYPPLVPPKEIFEENQEPILSSADIAQPLLIHLKETKTQNQEQIERLIKANESIDNLLRIYTKSI